MINAPNRRLFLASSGVACAAAFLRTPASAAGARDPRLAVIILRGGLDGLMAVAPVGDPDYAGLRSQFALTKPGGERPGLPLNDFFHLHPAMPQFARLYGQGKALAVHATATNYRERSHFDGQDVLESGYAAPGKTDSGWLNRAVAALPAAARPMRGLGVGSSAPLVMRGAAPTLGWAPQNLPDPGADLARRALDLYAHRDPALGAALQAGVDTDKLAQSSNGDGAMKKPGGGMDSAPGMRAAAAGAARLIAAPDGPRVAALAFDGFDTHANEGAAQGQLANRLQGLDGAFEEFERNMGAAWKDTIVVAITEFGRTARINGTNGTDHGVGSVAFLAGGALAGGRVIADWPGLSQDKLYQARDLNPTIDLRSVLKGVLAEHLGLSEPVLTQKVFPQSEKAAPMKGLVAA